MRIGLNLLYLIPDVVGGTETYAVSLIRALAAGNPGDEFVAFLNRKAADLDLGGAKNIIRVVCPVDARNRFRRYLFEQTMFPGVAGRHSLDVLHSLGYVGPSRTACPHVVTIHDLNYARQGETMNPLRRTALKYFVGKSAARCGHVITVSEASKADILGNLKLSPSKVSVVYEAASDDVGSLPLKACDCELRRHRVQRPYIAALGGTSRHKNTARLLRVFARLAQERTEDLVLMGRLPKGTEIMKTIDGLGIRDRVHLTGYLPRRELNVLIQNARLFVFPSLYEGFGLPLLEAQKLGVPVACSDRGALSEIAGGTAILFDPESEESMGSSILQGLLSERRLSEIKERGIGNAARFSWARAARETMGIYRSLAGVHE
ncbi:MAG: glycosyltransferase family 4 protein [Candidatus Aminicenantales bacterium]